MLSVVWYFRKSFAGSLLAALSSQNFLVCCNGIKWLSSLVFWIAVNVSLRVNACLNFEGRFLLPTMINVRCSLFEVTLSITKSRQPWYWDLKASLVPMGFDISRIGQSSWSRFEAFPWVQSGLYFLRSRLTWMSRATGRLIVNAELVW